MDGRVPVRRGAVRTGQPAVRLRLVPLPDLPAVWRRSRDGFRQRSGRGFRLDREAMSWSAGSTVPASAGAHSAASAEARFRYAYRTSPKPWISRSLVWTSPTRSNPNSISSGTAGSPGSIPMTACRVTQNSDPKREVLKARSLPTRRRSPEAQANRLPRGCPRATAGSGCGEPRRPFGRPAGRP